MTSPALQAQSALLASYVDNSLFYWRVLKGCRLEINSARRKLGRDRLSPTEIREELGTAIKLGIYRAWMYHFLREQSLDPRTYFPKHRDRDRDFEMVQADFPEYVTFVPSVPVTEDEVFEATREEVRHIFNGKGTDAHQARYITQGTYNDDKSPRYDEPGYGRQPVDNVQESCGNLVVESAAFRLSTEHTFGPAVMKVADHLVRVFGLVPTTYWVFEKMVYPGEYAQLLRIFGGDIEKDPSKFKSMQVDLARKLRMMDEELASLATRGDLKDYYDNIEAA